MKEYFFNRFHCICSFNRSFRLCLYSILEPCNNTYSSNGSVCIINLWYTLKSDVYNYYGQHCVGQHMSCIGLKAFFPY